MHPSQTVLWIGVAYVTSEKISIKDASRLPFVSFARGGFHSRKTCGHQQISWVQAYDGKRHRVLGQEPDKLEALLGLQRYEEQYVSSLAANTRTAFRHELGTWTCQVACPEFAVTLVACPEDKVCDGPQHCPANRMCAHCRVPICVACCDSLYRHGQKPAEALTNDMLLGYPPRDLYALQCTVLEVLSASPCLTALTCFSIEWRYLSDRSLGARCLYEPPPPMRERKCHDLSAAMGRSFVRTRKVESYRGRGRNVPSATCRRRIARQDCCPYQGWKQARRSNRAAKNYSPSCGSASRGGRFDRSHGVTRPPGIQRCRHGCRDTTGRAVARRRCTGRNCRLVRE